MTLNCPGCQSKAMEPFAIGKDSLYKCPSCHGFWFNGEELRDIEELPESQIMNDFQDQLDDASITDSKTAVANRLCPECGKPMDSYQYDISSGVWIHGCSAGHGVWLEKGEILKIHRHLQDAMKALPPQKMKAILDQLKQVEADEKRKEEEAVMSVFSDHKGSAVPIPLWHLMDGVTRFLYHTLFKLGV